MSNFNGKDLLKVFKELDVQLLHLDPNVIMGWFDTDDENMKNLLNWMCTSLSKKNYVSPLESAEYNQLNTKIPTDKLELELKSIEKKYPGLLDADTNALEIEFLQDEIDLMQEEEDNLKEIIRINQAVENDLMKEFDKTISLEIESSLQLKTAQEGCLALGKQLDELNEEIHNKLLKHGKNLRDFEFSSVPKFINNIDIEVYRDKVEQMTAKLIPVLEEQPMSVSVAVTSNSTCLDVTNKSEAVAQDLLNLKHSEFKVECCEKELTETNSEQVKELEKQQIVMENNYLKQLLHEVQEKNNILMVNNNLLLEKTKNLEERVRTEAKNANENIPTDSWAKKVGSRSQDANQRLKENHYIRNLASTSSSTHNQRVPLRSPLPESEKHSEMAGWKNNEKTNSKNQHSYTNNGKSELNQMESENEGSIDYNLENKRQTEENEGFQYQKLSRYAKRRLGTGKVSEEDVDNGFVGAERKVWLYIYRVKTHVSEKMIKDYIAKKETFKNEQIGVQELPSDTGRLKRIFHSRKNFLATKIEVEKLKEMRGYLDNVRVESLLTPTDSSFLQENIESKKESKRLMCGMLDEIATDFADQQISLAQLKYVEKELETFQSRLNNLSKIEDSVLKLMSHYLVLSILYVQEKKDIDGTDNFFRKVIHYISNDLENCKARTEKMNQIIKEYNNRAPEERFALVRSIIKMLAPLEENFTISRAFEMICNFKKEVGMLENKLLSFSFGDYRSTAPDLKESINILQRFLVCGPTHRVISVPSELHFVIREVEEVLKKQSASVKSSVEMSSAVRRIPNKWQNYRRQLWMYFYAEPHKLKFVLHQIEEEFAKSNIKKS